MTDDINRTENGAPTNETSGNPVVDYFFVAGAARNMDVRPMIDRALAADKELTRRAILWTRDVRGGAGERSTFRKVLNHLEDVDPDMAERLVRRIPDIGRWDDALVAKTDRVKAVALDMIADALRAGNGLAAKWMPRKGKMAAEIRTHMGLTPKQYRRLVVDSSKTVEQDMCAGRWTSINYEHVPSVAMSRYRKAFQRHDADGVLKYVEEVKAGTKKVNASVVFPYDVVRVLREGSMMETELVKDQVQIQWDALPNYVPEGKTFLPIVDVSGSMEVPVSGSVTAMDISIGMGLYLSERATGPFKDKVLTFSEEPKLVTLTEKAIGDRIDEVQGLDWGGSTNVDGAFMEVLNYAKANGLKQEDLPSALIVISDMEFDQATILYTSKGYRSASSYESAKAHFEAAGYSIPRLVFWQVNAHSSKNNPVTINDAGTVLISGYSPAIFKAAMNGDLVTAEDVVRDTLMAERYDQ